MSETPCDKARIVKRHFRHFKPDFYSNNESYSDRGGGAQSPRADFEYLQFFLNIKSLKVLTYPKVYLPTI